MGILRPGAECGYRPIVSPRKVLPPLDTRHAKRQIALDIEPRKKIYTALPGRPLWKIKAERQDEELPAAF